MIKIKLSNKLGELRIKQSDLARMTGIRPTTINEMYHELIERVNLNHLNQICKVLHCDLTEIMIYEEDKTTNKRHNIPSNNILSNKLKLK